MRLKRAKTTSRAKKPARSRRSRKPAASSPSYVAWGVKTRAIVLGVFCAVVAVAMLSAREDPPKAAVERKLPVTRATSEVDIPRRGGTTKPEVTKASRTVQRQPATASVDAPTADDSSAFAPRTTAEIVATLEAQPEMAAAVTVSGCLENDGGVYRLTDVSGADAPMSRSWKSGFLRRRRASIEVADAAGTLSLQSFVGRRVSTSGTLIDREMRARSVRAVGACE